MDFRFYRSPAPSGQEGAVYNTDASFVSLYYFNNTVILFDLNVKGGGEYSEFLKNEGWTDVTVPAGCCEADMLACPFDAVLLAWYDGEKMEKECCYVSGSSEAGVV